MTDFFFPLKVNEQLILNIKVNVKEINDKKLFYCFAYLTDEIPIVEIIFSIIDISKLELVKYSEFHDCIKKFISTKTKEYISIHRFTNFNNDIKSFSSFKYSEKYRGLGKKCIKKCLNYCVKLYSIDTENTPIILECSGSIPSDKNFNRFEELTKYSKLELLELFEKYNIVNKKDFDDYLNDKKIKNLNLETYSREELLENFSELIIDFENNNKLSEYYFRNFKLEILEDFSIYYKTMCCILNDFIN